MIRALKHSDRAMLTSWWARSGSPVLPEAYPEGYSYIYEDSNGIPKYAVGLQIIKGMKNALVDGFIRNPELKPDIKEVQELQEYLDNVAKSEGITMIYALTKDEGVYKHHARCGYVNTPIMLYTSYRRLN